MTDAERHELADRCDRIDRAGGSVREYLRSRGFISPWGTWHRLQKEELGRTEYQITEGKGAEIMRKLTLEDKQKAVDVAINGGNPVAYLKEIGNANPSAAWYYIKKTLKAVDPEKFDQLMNRSQLIQDEDGVRMRTADGDEFPITEVLQHSAITELEKPGVKMTINSEDIRRAVNDPEEYPKMLALKKEDEITGIRTKCGEFHVKNGYLRFASNDRDELEMPVEVWRTLKADLPRVMNILCANFDKNGDEI